MGGPSVLHSGGVGGDGQNGPTISHSSDEGGGVEVRWWWFQAAVVSSLYLQIEGE
jgi:hypothetical protein